MSEWIKISDQMPNTGQKVIVLSDTIDTGSPLLKRPYWVATYRNYALEAKQFEAVVDCEIMMKNYSIPRHVFHCHDGVERNPDDFHWWLPIPDAPAIITA